MSNPFKKTITAWLARDDVVNTKGEYPWLYRTEPVFDDFRRTFYTSTVEEGVPEQLPMEFGKFGIRPGQCRKGKLTIIWEPEQ